MEDFKITDIPTTMPKINDHSQTQKPDFLEYLERNDISPMTKPMRIQVLNFDKDEDNISEIPFSFD